MAISISYSYKVDAKFILDGIEEPIITEGITSIITNFDYDNSFINQLEEDALIAIKGFISLDIDANVIIIANKLSFLSSNKSEGDQ